MNGEDSQLRDRIIMLTGFSELPAGSPDMFRQQLSVYINELIIKDFTKLVGILYRLDVSESGLRQMLEQNPGTDAGKTIADAIIEREKEKIRSRKRFSQRDSDIPEDEKW